MVILLIEDIFFMFLSNYFWSYLFKGGCLLDRFLGFAQLRLMMVFGFGRMLSLSWISFYLDKELKFGFTSYLDLFEARLIDFIIVWVDAFGDTKLLGKAIELLRLFS